MDLPQGAIPGALHLCSLRSQGRQDAARLLRCASALRVTPFLAAAVFYPWKRNQKSFASIISKHNFPFTPHHPGRRQVVSGREVHCRIAATPSDSARGRIPSQRSVAELADGGRTATSGIRHQSKEAQTGGDDLRLGE